jgi:TolA-binding protein
MKICKPEYLERANLLSQEEQERLMSRMAGKLPKRLQKEKLSVQEAIAIQLEIEDEQLQEWRTRMQQIKKDNDKKASKQAIKAEKKNIPTIKTTKKTTAKKSATPVKKPAVAKKSTTTTPKPNSAASTPKPLE